MQDDKESRDGYGQSAGASDGPPRRRATDRPGCLLRHAMNIPASERRRASDIVRIEADQMFAGMARSISEVTRQAASGAVRGAVCLQEQDADVQERLAALELSRGKYFDLYDLAPIGYLTLCEEGRITGANCTIAGMLGVAKDTLLAAHQPLAHYLLAEDVDTFSDHLNQLFRTGQSQVFEIRVVPEGGRPLWVRMDLAVIGQGRGQGRPGCRLVASDIAAQKQQEEVLRTRNEHLKNMLHDAPVGEWEIDLATLRMRCSQAHAEIFGYFEPQADWNLARFLGHVHPEDRAEVERSCHESMVSGREWHEECRITQAESAVRWVRLNASVLVNSQGKPYKMAGMTCDLTMRKSAEETLQENEEIFRQFMENSPIYVFFKDENIRTVRLSRNFEKMLGRPVAEMLGKTMDELFPSDIAKKMIAEDKKILNEGRLFSHEEKLGGRWYATTRFPLSLHGRPRYLAGYSIDITDRKRAEEENEKLMELNRQLQKEESLGRMAGAIAHHLNNRLHVVMGNIDLAIDDLCRGRDAFGYLTEAKQGTRKASEVSNLMLTYIGQTPGKCEPLDLSEVCQQSLLLLQAGMPKKGVAIQSDFTLPGPIIQVNANQIQQVVINLVTNAWESLAGKGGTVRLTVATVSAADIPTEYRFPTGWQPGEKRYACLVVADDGCGIASTEIMQLFDPFFTRKLFGRGMGLAVVQGIVRACNGAVTVESGPERGSVFRVFLPVIAEAIDQQPPEAHGGVEFTVGGTVLLIDDDQIVQEVTGRMLTNMGFLVLGARDGIEAVELFRQHKNDIRFVLSDLSMPGIDGWETLAELRRFSPGVRFILASGYDERQIMAGEHAELPQSVLVKPYRIEQLRAAISCALADEASGQAS